MRRNLKDFYIDILYTMDNNTQSKIEHWSSHPVYKNVFGLFSVLTKRGSFDMSEFNVLFSILKQLADLCNSHPSMQDEDGNKGKDRAE